MEYTACNDAPLIRHPNGTYTPVYIYIYYTRLYPAARANLRQQYSYTCRGSLLGPSIKNAFPLGCHDFSLFFSHFLQPFSRFVFFSALKQVVCYLPFSLRFFLPEFFCGIIRTCACFFLPDLHIRGDICGFFHTFFRLSPPVERRDKRRTYAL